MSILLSVINVLIITRVKIEHLFTDRIDGKLLVQIVKEQLTFKILEIIYKKEILINERGNN